MKGIFKHHDFLRLYLANIVSRFGDAIDMIAFGVLVYQLTGSKLLLASIYIVNVVPNIIFGTFAGAIVDFYSKKKITVVGDFIRGGVVLLAGYLFYVGQLETWHLFAMTFINSTTEAFVSPCKYSTIPKLVDEEYYLHVNSTFQSVQGIIELLGLAIAGVIIGSFGVHTAMMIDAATFILSGLIIMTVAFPKEEKKSFTASNYFSAYWDGMKYLNKKKALLGLIISGALINFFLTPFNALMPAYVKDILNMGPEGISFMSVCLAIGGILGGILAGAIGKRLGAKGLVMMGLSLLAVFYIALGLPGFDPSINNIYLIGVDFALVAAMASVAGAGVRTYLMTNIDKEMLARISGVMNMIMLCATPFGAFMAGMIVAIVPLHVMIVGFGSMIFLAVLIPAFSLKSEKALEEKVSETVA